MIFPGHTHLLFFLIDHQIFVIRTLIYDVNLSAFCYAIGDVTTRALIGFYSLSGADINRVNVRKGQDIMLAGIPQCWGLYPRSILLPWLSALGKQCDGCIRGIRF